MTGYRFRGGLAALGLAWTCAVSGCGFFGHTSGDSPPTQLPVSLSCPVKGAAPLTLVVGARANSPRPELPAQIQTLMQDAALDGQHIQVVRLDGTPAVVLDAQFSSASQNPRIRDRALNSFVARTQQFVASLRPQSPEADVLAALSLAGQDTPAGGTIVVLDSGVATTGQMSFQDQTMFGAVPTQFADFLKAQDLLPDLKGKSVVFVNLGQTADPQPGLDQNIRTRIVDLWATIATKAGVTCQTSLQVSSPQASVRTDLAVAVVQPRPAPSFRTCGTTTLGDDGTVGFVAGKPEFRDPATAQTTLRSLAQLLVGHTQLVKLVGAVSSEGDPHVDLVLSLARAEAVKQALVGMGVDPSRITTEGAGVNGPGHKVDKTPQGVLIPSAAVQNRSVTVILSCQG